MLSTLASSHYRRAYKTPLRYLLPGIALSLDWALTGRLWCNTAPFLKAFPCQPLRSISTFPLSGAWRMRPRIAVGWARSWQLQSDE